MNIDNKHLRWLLDNPNDLIQKCLIRGNFYDRDHLDLMKTYIKPESTIIDIGANIGNHTVFFSKFTDAKLIYSIEPIERCYRMLLCNIALNYCHNVNIDYIGIGLGSFSCTAYPFTVYGKDNLGSTRMFDTPNPFEFVENHKKIFNSEPDRFPPVKIIKGDDIFSDKKVDFIKIDAEGMDVVIMEGLSETIQKNRPIIFIEITNENQENFSEWLKNNNYKVEHEISHSGYDPKDLHSGQNYLISPI